MAIPLKEISTVGILLLSLTCAAGEQKRAPSASEINDRVNQYISKTYIEMEHQKMAHPLNAAPLAPPAETSSLQKSPYKINTQTYDVLMEPPAETPLRQTYSPQNPSDYVEQRLYQSRENALRRQELARQQEEYVKKFKENAARAGVNVVIDENYNVIDYSAPKAPKKQRRTIQSVDELGAR